MAFLTRGLPLGAPDAVTDLRTRSGNWSLGEKFAVGILWPSGPGIAGMTESKYIPKLCDQLTSAELAGEPLSQLTSLGELLPETLPQVVVNVIASKEVFKRFYCVFCMLSEKVTNTSPFSYFLPKVGQFSGLILNQGIIFSNVGKTEGRKNGKE